MSGMKGESPLEQLRLTLDDQEERVNLNMKIHQSFTLFMIAVISCQASIAKLLIEREADTTIKDDTGYTAQNYAQHSQNKELIALFS